MAIKFIKAFGIIIGLMFGAGVFALPYAISRAGVFWGTVHLIVAGYLTIHLLVLYGKIAYFTDGEHRFTGYVEKFLGKKAKVLAFLVTSAAYYGALLAYGVLGGLFISNFFGNFSVSFSYLFFAVGALVVFLRLGKIALINFYFTIPIFLFVILLFFDSLPLINLSNFNFSGPLFNSFWFLPYGIWIFSLSAFGAIPGSKEFFDGLPFSHFKKVITASVFISALFYCLFVFSIVGISGGQTTEDAFSGVLGILGNKIILFGSIMGFLAVFTSFLALAADLKYMYQYDFKISRFFSWLFVVLPPTLFFYLGMQDFTRILSCVGVVGIGLSGVFILFMARKIRKEEGESRGSFLELLTGVAIVAAVLYELVRLL